MLKRLECVASFPIPGMRAPWLDDVFASFPSVEVAMVDGPSDRALCIDLSEWRGRSFSLWDFDQKVEDAVASGVETFALIAHTRAHLEEVFHVVTRCQRLTDRRNRHSTGSRFDEGLQAHRAIYDLSKPLMLADYRHALDTWQWTLRLDAEASAPLQWAALLHDVERIVSESDVRIEHLAENYQRFKTAHARRGSEMTRRFLKERALPAAELDRVVALVASHEAPSGDADLALLNDADALSFFSLNSSGFIDYFGAAHAARKIRYTLGRMRASAIAELARLRLRPDVARLTREALGAYDASSATSAP